MLRKFRGIKPPHLWRYTSIKDFLYVLNKRLTARENLEQRDKKDFLQLVAIVLASSIGMLYSYGKISPARTLTTIIPDPCKPLSDPKNDASQQESPKIETLPPCKPVKDEAKPKPCP